MQCRLFIFPVALCCFAPHIVSTAHAAESGVNPNFSYFSDGDTPDGWYWVLADPGNWWLPLEGNEGVSGSEKIKMEKSPSPDFDGAIRLSWSKEDKWGGAIITGRTLDLSSVEQVGELVLAMKLDERTHQPVYVKMTCGDNCAGQVSIQYHLKSVTLGEWFALPIPLDCFVEQGADLKKIDSPFQIGTNGKMVLHIAEVGIRKMPEGDEGCIPNGDTD